MLKKAIIGDILSIHTKMCPACGQSVDISPTDLQTFCPICNELVADNSDSSKNSTSPEPEDR